MANNIQNVTDVGKIFSKDAAAVVSDSLKFLGSISREDDSQYKKKFNDVGEGDDIAIRKPARFTSRTGLAFSGQDFQESNVVMTRANVIGVDITGFNAIEITNDMTEAEVKGLSDRVIVPAAKQLASDLESAVATQLYKDVYNATGTPGTTPNTVDLMTDNAVILDEFLAPENDRCIILNSRAKGEIIKANGGKFNPSAEISKQYSKFVLGEAAGFDIMTNQLMPYHTNGTMGGTPLVNGGSQTGSSLTIDGLGANATVTAGTIFTLTNVKAIHPELRTSYSSDQQFVVTADATANGSGAVTLSISPEIVVTGSGQTVSGSPADNAAVTFLGAASGSYIQNLFYHKDAFRFMTLDLPKMKDADVFSNASMDGIEVTFHQYWDKDAYKLKTRLDVLWGAATVRPEHAGRLFG